MLLLFLFLVFQTSTHAPSSHCSDDLVAFAMERTALDITYDPSYLKLDYPNGDVPSNTGVCTDVVIRTYRELGFDFQQAVHEDMKFHFDQYPKRWGLTKPDKNIDHRRVPNIMTYLQRHDYLASGRPQPGDILCWDIGSGVTHIGIVVDATHGINVVHNIGAGPKKEPESSTWTRIGHYRFCP